MSNVIVKLILGIFFLVIGGMILVSEHLGLKQRFNTVLGINPGWLGIVFGAVNLLRAWIAWNDVKRRGEQADALRTQWERHRHRPRARSTEPPDPNFQFTEQPAAAPANGVVEEDTSDTPEPRPPVRKHWERQGGALGFLAGILVGVIKEWDHLSGDAPETAFGSIVIYAFVGAISWAILGAILGLLVDKSRPQNPA